MPRRRPCICWPAPGSRSYEPGGAGLSRQPIAPTYRQIGERCERDDRLTLDGWLKNQGVDPATPEELEMWRGLFDETMELLRNAPKLGRMKQPRKPGEQRYAIAVEDAGDSWLTFWVK